MHNEDYMYRETMRTIEARGHSILSPGMRVKVPKEMIPDMPCDNYREFRILELYPHIFTAVNSNGIVTSFQYTQISGMSFI